MTTNQEVLDWIQTARNLHCTHVLIVRQGHTDQYFPINVRPGEDVNVRAAAYNGKNGQVVVEVIPLNQK